MLLPSVWQLVWLTTNVLSCPCRMGNVALAALDDVHFNRDVWGAQMEMTPSFQYAYNNIPESLFSGYAWSLDTFVDFTWQDLTNLSVIIIVLLVVEVRDVAVVWRSLPAGRRGHSCVVTCLCNALPACCAHVEPPAGCACAAELHGVSVPAASTLQCSAHEALLGLPGFA